MDRWLVYGMLACLLAECEEERGLANLMTTEAEGEGMLEDFEEGDEEMYQWLVRQHNPRLYKNAMRNRSPSARRPTKTHYGGWPLSVH